MKNFQPIEAIKTKYIFFTGKGGVGKTSLACATALSLADEGKKVFLISTDPASNLQDVFSMDLDNKGINIPEIPNLVVANLDPIKAAAEYRENIVTPYRGLLPDEAIVNIEEQLSGSCTIEIAAFNEFANFITDEKIRNEYDNIIFDTAPTGHTLRMLQLPSAWSNFISESTHGASCLGQLAGLEDRKSVYKDAVNALADATKTTLILVSRPEEIPFKEAERASRELSELGLKNQILIINGIFLKYNDKISKEIYNKQQNALEKIPETLKIFPVYQVPLRTYNISSIENIRYMLKSEKNIDKNINLNIPDYFNLKDVVKDLYKNGRKVIFIMGKGGVGKTTIAAAIALELSKSGQKVHLTTTDPAAHLEFVLDNTEKNITISHIDEHAELKKYQNEVLAKAKENGMSENDIAYIEEDLRSPCTQEIAVFRAFAEVVEKADNQIVIIDTAPTGHTLLLLESTESYDHEIRRTKGETPEAVKKLLPRLRSNDTEVIIVTLPEATPFYEALRLEEELHRARIAVNWWIVNQSLSVINSSNELLSARANNEVEWLNKISEHTKEHFALIAWNSHKIK